MSTRATPSKHWLPLGMLIASAVFVPVQLLRPEGLPRMRELEREREVTATHNERLGKEIARLRLEVAALRQDPESVERVARDKLGLVRKNEILVYFTERGKAEAPAAP